MKPLIILFLGFCAAYLFSAISEANQLPESEVTEATRELDRPAREKAEEIIRRDSLEEGSLEEPGDETKESIESTPTSEQINLKEK